MAPAALVVYVAALAPVVLVVVVVLADGGAAQPASARARARPDPMRDFFTVHCLLWHWVERPRPLVVARQGNAMLSHARFGYRPNRAGPAASTLHRIS